MSKPVWVAGREPLLLDLHQWIPMLCFSVLPESFPDISGYFFEKCQELI
jgi:hypothetical protein